MAITRSQQARQMYRTAGAVQAAYGAAAAEKGPVEDKGNPQQDINQINQTVENLGNIENIQKAFDTAADINYLKNIVQGSGAKGVLSAIGGPLIIGNILKKISQSNRNKSITIDDSEEESFADGGRIGLRFGSEGYQGGATNQGGAGKGTDVGRSGSEGNRDRRRVEQYTKPPTVVGGSGDQKTPVVVNPLKNLPTHFANNQKLKDAVALGLITNDEYNILGGYDVKQTMGMGPVDSFIGSLAYNTVQSLKGDQPFGEIFGDAKRTAIGASNISPELQTKYENIMQMADGGRAGLAEGGMPYEGGIMDLESARQMYGLGKLVKKVTRSVKKIAKSPIGKAALLYTGVGGLGNMAAGQSFFSNFASPSRFLSGASNIFKSDGLRNILVGMPQSDAMMPSSSGFFGTAGKLNPLRAISAVSAVAGFLTPEEEDEAQQIADNTGIDIEIIRANPNQYLGRRFRAEGGSMKEPVAKKTMPLLDMDGQEMDLRAEGGFVPIGRMEKADDVPARLSKNEFVFTADAVRNAGDGDVDKGAEVMYNMMKNLESGGEVSEESQGLEGARKMFQTSQRLEEVL